MPILSSNQIPPNTSRRRGGGAFFRPSSPAVPRRPIGLLLQGLIIIVGSGAVCLSVLSILPDDSGQPRLAAMPPQAARANSEVPVPVFPTQTTPAPTVRQDPMNVAGSWPPNPQVYDYGSSSRPNVSLPLDPSQFPGGRIPVRRAIPVEKSVPRTQPRSPVLVAFEEVGRNVLGAVVQELQRNARRAPAYSPRQNVTYYRTVPNRTRANRRTMEQQRAERRNR